MKKYVFLLISVFVFLFAFANTQHVYALDPQWKLVVRIAGEVDSQKFQAATWDKIWQSRMLTDGDKARTLLNSRAKICLADQSEVTIGSDTVVEISQFKLTPQSRFAKINLLAGKLRIKVGKFFGKESKFEVTTPTAVLAARGTDFYVSQEAAEQKPAVGFTSNLFNNGFAALGGGAPIGPLELIVFDGVVTAQIGNQVFNIMPGQTLVLGPRGVFIVPTSAPRAPAPGVQAAPDADLQSPTYEAPAQTGPAPPAPQAPRVMPGLVPTAGSVPIFNPSSNTGNLPVVIQ